jgi:hypothetical protein
MAGESLGTMTVGVAADVSPAERALNSLAEMLESFERKMAAPRVRQKPIVKIEDFVGPLTPDQQAQMERERAERIEASRNATASKLRFATIRNSEMEAVARRRAIDELQRNYEIEEAQREANDKKAAAAQQRRDEARAKREEAEAKRREALVVKMRERALKRGWSEEEFTAADFESQKKMARGQRAELMLGPGPETLARQEALANSVASKLRFATIRNSELQALAKRQEIDQLQAEAERQIAEEQKTQERREKQLQRHIDRLHDLAVKRERAIKAAAESKGWDMSTWQDMPAVEQARMARTAPQMEQMDAHVREFQRRRVEELHHVEASANRVRYGMMNLAYGVQDAATVFGTGGFAGAIRASANNLQGLGIVLQEMKSNMGGIKEAMYSAEFAIVGISTALMIGADLWTAYAKRLDEAAEATAKLKLQAFKPERDVEEAGRAAGFKQQLEDIDSVKQAENQLANTRKELRKNEAEAAAALKGFTEARARAFNIDDILRQVKELRNIPDENLPGLRQMRGEVEALGGESAAYKARRDLYQTSERLEKQYQQLVHEGHLLRVEETMAEQKLQEQQASADKKEADENNERLDKEAKKRDEEADKRKAQEEEQFERAKVRALRDYEQYVQGIEQGVNRLSQRVQAYDPTEGIGGAAFGSAEAFDALGKARQGPSPDSQALQDMKELLRNANNNLNDIRLNTLPSMKAEDEAEMVRKAHNLLFNNALGN